MTETRVSSQLHELSAIQAAALIRQRQLSPVELVQALIARAESVDQHVRAWQRLDAERALEAARLAEQAAGSTTDLPPLHGVPFGAKDIYDTAGLQTTCGFRPYADRVPAVDSEPVARL